MRRKTAIVLGVSGAALALTASSAFTAGGLTFASTATGFIGGTQAVTVEGTEVSTIAYTQNSAGTELTDIVFTFSDDNAETKVPTLTVTRTGGAADITDWTCGAVTTTSGTTASTCSKGTSGTAVSLSTLDTIKLTVA